MRSTFDARLVSLALALVSVAPAATRSLALQSPPTPPGIPLGVGGTFAGASVAIPDSGAFVNSSIPVSGAGTYLWDVDVHVTIGHANAEDLDVALIAPPPSNLVVTLSTDNGGPNAISQAILYDDSAVTTVAQATGQTWVIPEGALTSLQGINPNGTWKLRVRDDTTNSLTGTLSACSIDLVTLNALPPLTRYGPTTFATSPNAPIPDNGTLVADSIAFLRGMGLFLAEVRVFAKIAHPSTGQLEIGLRHALGTYVPLSLHNGGANANVFSNTTWRDGARSAPNDLPTTDATYWTGVAKIELVPEGALGRFIGVNPNSGWTLEIKDTVAGQAGTLLKWSVTCWTYDAPAAAGACFGTINSQGCVTALGTTYDGNGALQLLATNVLNNKPGLFFYGFGVSSPPTVWGNGTLCVKSPLQITSLLNSGGNPPPNDCSGSYLLGWQAFLGANPYALGSPIANGITITTQLYSRDPGVLPGFNLSNYMQFQSQP